MENICTRDDEYIGQCEEHAVGNTEEQNKHCQVEL